jgi:hypothetical protein
MEQTYIYIGIGVVVLTLIISSISSIFSGSSEKKDEVKQDENVNTTSNIDVKLRTAELLNRDITLAGTISSSSSNTASAPGIKDMSVKSSNTIDIIDQK